MEIPRYWRGMPVMTSFTGKEIGFIGVGLSFFKYPGGEIPLIGTCEEIYQRFESRGFKPEVIEEILSHLFRGVASEPSISSEKIIDSESEFVGSEVGE